MTGTHARHTARWPLFLIFAVVTALVLGATFLEPYGT